MQKEKFTVVVDENKVITKEQLIFGLFGISLDQLIEDIYANKDGKYDDVYVHN